VIVVLRPGLVKPKSITLIFAASLHTALRRKSKDWLALNQEPLLIKLCAI
jgi:hypothetical protein